MTCMWCGRCGRTFETAARPSCECAGDVPIDGHTGQPLPNFRPEMSGYRQRVDAVRVSPENAETWPWVRINVRNQQVGGAR